jgi:signal peptidase I
VIGRVLGIAGALVGLVVVAALVLFFAVAKHYRMPSSSMEPTFHCARPAPGCEASSEDHFIVFTFLGWRRGDVVAFHAPAAAVARCGSGGTFVKRVLAVGGETVHEDGRGFIAVDGHRLDESYIPASDRARDTSLRNRTWHVPAGQYFLVGDNRGLSCDSRVYGAVPKNAVIGRVFMTYWPLGRLSFR